MAASFILPRGGCIPFEAVISHSNLDANTGQYTVSVNVKSVVNGNACSLMAVFIGISHSGRSHVKGDEKTSSQLGAVDKSPKTLYNTISTCNSIKIERTSRHAGRCTGTSNPERGIDPGDR